MSHKLIRTFVDWVFPFSKEPHKQIMFIVVDKNTGRVEETPFPQLAEEILYQPEQTVVRPVPLE